MDEVECVFSGHLGVGVGIIVAMPRQSLSLSLVLISTACGGNSQSDSRQIRAPEYTDEERSAGIFMKDTGRPILHCFHPSQKSRGGAVHRVEFVKPRRAIDATIFMEGYTGAYYMRVLVELDFATQRIRVTPTDEDTKFPANPRCALREWTSFDDIDAAAAEAKAEHMNAVAVGVSLAASALLSRSEAERRAPECLTKAMLDEAVDGTVEKTLSSTAQRAIVSGAIKQTYAENPSVRGVAKEALSYAIIAKVREYDSHLADALGMASLAACLIGG